jgi:hypothetical protein
MVQIHVHVDIELNAHDVHLECSLSSKHKSEMKDKKNNSLWEQQNQRT